MSLKHAALAACALLLGLALVGCGTGTPSRPASSASGGAAQTPEQLGEQIFQSGNGANGSAIQASAGSPGPCAHCHGANAQGAIGPDIRWSVLTGATSSDHAPRFQLTSEAQFATAVTTGEAAGNQLRPMMPHFQLNATETAALVAYLKTL